MNGEETYRPVWLWSLGFFILAALTGFLYRVGMLTSLPFDLTLNHVRHAHSHLMFFNWVTPVPMLLMASRVAPSTPVVIRSFKRCLYTMMAMGFTAFPFFILYGYQSVPVGSAELPFSVILSGGVMVTWYWFLTIYMKVRRYSTPGLPRLFYESALLMLVVSSLGAWGLAVFQFGDIENPLFSSALTHFFLSVFTEGWCVLAALGILYQYLNIEYVPLHESWLVAPIVLGVPLMFPFGMPVDLLTNQLLIAASFGSLLVTAGLVINLVILTRYSEASIPWWWRVVLNLLGAKILMQFGAAVLPFTFWLGDHGLRVFYLHVVLLGFVSLSFFAAWHSLRPQANKTGLKLMAGSVLLVLLSLLLISGWWPSAWQPGGLYRIVALVALFPAIAAVWEWRLIFKAPKQG